VIKTAKIAISRNAIYKPTFICNFPKYWLHPFQAHFYRIPDLSLIAIYEISRPLQRRNNCKHEGCRTWKKSGDLLVLLEILFGRSKLRFFRFNSPIHDGKIPF